MITALILCYDFIQNLLFSHWFWSYIFFLFWCHAIPRERLYTLLLFLSCVAFVLLCGLPFFFWKIKVAQYGHYLKGKINMILSSFWIELQKSSCLNFLCRALHTCKILKVEAMLYILDNSKKLENCINLNI